MVLKLCTVEILNLDAMGMPHLPVQQFPTLLDSTELKFEHGASHKRCTIARKQVPIEPDGLKGNLLRWVAGLRDFCTRQTTKRRWKVSVTSYF